LATLAEKILRDFSKVKLRKVTIKVPRFKNKKLTNQKEQEQTPNSSIISILIKTAVEKAKRERKVKPVDEEKSYKILKGERDLIFNGGYGTNSKGYGATPHTTYVDYGKLFSYLGTFRAKQPYDNMAEHVASLNKTTESGSFVLADKDAMDKIGRYDKYMKNPSMDMPVMALSLVPIAGLSSGEWEEIKMFMKLDPVIYALKTKTA
jgi:hypothetical protein